MEDKLVRVALEQLEPLPEGVAVRIAELAELPAPVASLTVSVHNRLVCVSSTVRVAGKAVGGPVKRNTFHLAVLTLAYCMEQLLARDEGVAYTEYYRLLKEARYAVERLRDIDALFYAAVVAEREVPAGVSDEDLPNSVKRAWKEARNCFYKLRDYAGVS